MSWEAQLNYNADMRDALLSALEALDKDELVLAIANDRYCMFTTFKEKHSAIFDRWVRDLSKLTHDVLVDDCYRRALRTNTADAGGGVIWIDKGGCSKVVLA